MVAGGARPTRGDSGVAQPRLSGGLRCGSAGAGCRLALCNDSLGVHEVAGCGEPSASQGPGGARASGTGARGARGRASLHLSRRLPDVPAGSPACPKADEDGPCFPELASPGPKYPPPSSLTLLRTPPSKPTVPRPAITAPRFSGGSRAVKPIAPGGSLPAPEMSSGRGRGAGQGWPPGSGGGGGEVAGAQRRPLGAGQVPTGAGPHPESAAAWTSQGGLRAAGPLPPLGVPEDTLEDSQGPDAGAPAGGRIRGRWPGSQRAPQLEAPHPFLFSVAPTCAPKPARPGGG